MTLGSLDLGGGGTSFPFKQVGDSVTGTIIDLEEVQQTSVDTGQPLTWDNGQPRLMYRVDLDTELRNDEFDDGRRSVYLKGARKSESKSSLAAVLDAVRAAGAGSKLERGGTLTLTYTGNGVPKNPAYTPPKQYSATYRRPNVTVDLDGPPVAAAQPAYTPPTGQEAYQAPAPSGPVNPTTGLPYTPEQVAALQAAGLPIPGL